MSDGGFDPVEHFKPLWDMGVNQAETFPSYRPLIAHYCSQSTLEAIVRNEEFWLSNPLYANDYEELNFGLLHGRTIALESSAIRSAISDQTAYNGFKSILANIFALFEQGQLKQDIHIACFSMHDESDNNGLLSMWRGYGADGSGVAIVLKTSALKEDHNLPLILDKVRYGNRPRRLAWIDDLVGVFATLVAQLNIKSSNPGWENLIGECAQQLFERLLMFSLFTKDLGFQEECEFRIAYLRYRDIHKRFVPMLSYAVVGNAIQPKFKLKIDSVLGADDKPLNLDLFIDRIIVGPSSVSDLSIWAVNRMLDVLGRNALVGRVVASTIPYRPKSVT